MRIPTEYILAITEETLPFCGFRGSPFCNLSIPPSPQNTANLAMTYTALCCLLILNDPLVRVNRPALLDSIPYYQNSDGSFSPVSKGMESDLRFCYCAVAIVFILKRADMREAVFSTDRLINYIKSCIVRFFPCLNQYALFVLKIPINQSINLKDSPRLIAYPKERVSRRINLLWNRVIEASITDGHTR